MHIGLDFDNTIVSYDGLFHKVALEGGWIPDDLPVSKICVRDHLRKINKEDVWTEMQGHVYGGRMAEATAFPGLIACLNWAKEKGFKLSIVSHKTRYPFLGKQYDLHQAAKTWIDTFLKTTTEKRLIENEDLFFELTKEAKVKRIADINCDVYIDDLPEILNSPEFPKHTEKILFDPDRHHLNSGLPLVHSWLEVHTIFEKKWN